MNQIKGVPLNIQAIVDSGQCFRWQKINDFFYGVVGDQIIKIRPTSQESFEWDTYPRKNNFQLLKWHFNLDKDYRLIISSINRDQFIDRAIQQYWGLRELRQPLFETIISYIISANNGIKMITRSIDLLTRKWGSKITWDGHDFFTFPEPGGLDRVSESELRKVTRIGFRAKYVKQTARKILSGEINLEELKRCGQSQACQVAQLLPGVGPKVADCIALFALGHDHVIPFDVWMKRVFVNIYKQPVKARYSDLQSFARQYFGEFAGWAHQFLFMYSREHGIEQLKAAPPGVVSLA